MVTKKEEKKSTIAVYESTKELLASCGNTNETYDDVIIKLVENFKK